MIKDIHVSSFGFAQCTKSGPSHSMAKENQRIEEAKSETENVISLNLAIKPPDFSRIGMFVECINMHVHKCIRPIKGSITYTKE
jgi:hypothetical protein